MYREVLQSFIKHDKKMFINFAIYKKMSIFATSLMNINRLQTMKNTVDYSLSKHKFQIPLTCGRRQTAAGRFFLILFKNKWMGIYFYIGSFKNGNGTMTAM